jgi:quinol monooxygenase YgiN
VAKFIQIIEFKTSRVGEIEALHDQWQAETQGKRTADRVTITQDRDRPGMCIVIAEFASYEDAMKNNDLPETQRISEQMMKLSDGEPTFRNLDVSRQT